MIRSRIIGTGRAVPAQGADQRRPLARWSTPPTPGSSSAPASASATSWSRRWRPAISATEAARKACRKAGVDPSAVDCIIVGTVTGDCPFPATATFVQKKLGAPAGRLRVRSVGGLRRLPLRRVDRRRLHSRRAVQARAGHRASRCSRASSTGPIARPACCSATARARCCMTAGRRAAARRPVDAPLRRRHADRDPLAAGGRQPRAAHAGGARRQAALREDERPRGLQARRAQHGLGRRRRRWRRTASPRATSPG